MRFVFLALAAGRRLARQARPYLLLVGLGAGVALPAAGQADCAALLRPVAPADDPAGNCARIAGLISEDAGPVLPPRPVRVVQFPRLLKNGYAVPADVLTIHNTRYCVRSYPWPARLPNGREPFPVEGKLTPPCGDQCNPLKVLNSAQMQAVRARTAAMLKLPRNAGHARQGRLYGDYLYLHVLDREGRYSEVVAEAARIRRQSYWQANYLAHQVVETAEEHTFYHPATLQKFIDQLDLEAQSRLPDAASVEQRRALLRALIRQ